MGPHFWRSFCNPLVLCAASSILAVEIWVYRQSISVRQCVLQLSGGSQTKGVIFWWCSIEWKLCVCHEMVSRLHIRQFFFIFQLGFFFLWHRWRLKGKIVRKYIMVIAGSPRLPHSATCIVFQPGWSERFVLRSQMLWFRLRSEDDKLNR